VYTKPDELVVMSWAGQWGKGLSEAVSKPFTEITGISIRHEINIGLKLPAILLGSLKEGLRPPFDVVWSNSVPAMRIAQKGWSDFLDETTVPNLTALSHRAKPEEFSGWPLVSPYIVYYVMVYREAAFPDREPDTWEVMMEPRFRGKVALYPGGNGFYPLAQVLGGGSLADIPRNMTSCWKYFRKLKSQVGKLDYSIHMGKLINNGELDICFRALPNAIAFRNEGLKVSWATPKEGITDTVDALWIPKKVPENVAYWSKQYINFALSRDVQQRWCGLMGVMPMHPEASIPDAFRGETNIPKSPDDLSGTLYIPESMKMQYELDWEMKFNEIFSY
jgi:putative spermidine/putrescine transport system substrate-binding protein